jgi:PAS domain-containing protein
MLKELSAVAQQLSQFDVEGGLVGMLASLVTASHEFIGIADLEGNALFVNEAGRKLVGLRDLSSARLPCLAPQRSARRPLFA